MTEPKDQLFPIILEDEQLLVVNKPAGLVCHPTKGNEYSSLVGRLRLYLGRSGWLVNRLDRETSGLIIVAKDSETAGQLGKIWGSRQVRKTYLAIVHGLLDNSQGLIDAPLGKDETSSVAIKDCVRPDGASATTLYSVVKGFENSFGRFSLLSVEPKTGRKHQIRIHLASIGHPVVGDKLYGGDEDAYLNFVRGRLTAQQTSRLILSNHALHALELDIPLPYGRRIFRAEPESEFKHFAELT